jgi:hypothetical protein
MHLCDDKGPENGYLRTKYRVFCPGYPSWLRLRTRYAVLCPRGFNIAEFGQEIVIRVRKNIIFVSPGQIPGT